MAKCPARFSNDATLFLIGHVSTSGTESVCLSCKSARPSVRLYERLALVNNRIIKQPMSLLSYRLINLLNADTLRSRTLLVRFIYIMWINFHRVCFKLELITFKLFWSTLYIMVNEATRSYFQTGNSYLTALFRASAKSVGRSCAKRREAALRLQRKVGPLYNNDI